MYYRLINFLQSEFCKSMTRKKWSLFVGVAIARVGNNSVGVLSVMLSSAALIASREMLTQHVSTMGTGSPAGDMRCLLDHFTLIDDMTR